MSRGPGRIERAIEAAFDAEPDNAFNIEDLCERVYHGLNRVEKKHRVAVLRAMRAVVRRRPDLDCMIGEGLGRPVVYYNPFNVMSYAMARLKTDYLRRYRNNDKRSRWPNTTEVELLARLAEGGKEHHCVVEGGTWWRHAQERIAHRDGDTVRAAALAEQGEKELQAIAQQLTALGSTIRPVK